LAGVLLQTPAFSVFGPQAACSMVTEKQRAALISSKIKIYFI
jgi:hypothetical protein